jgi:hypothetical protein
MILPGTYQNGFAPRDGEPLFPELWCGCVGAWNPGLGPTGTRLYDWSPYKNHGTLTNMDAGTDWVASQGRYALDFDGVNDRIVCGESRRFLTQSGTNWSVSAWVRIRGTGGSVQTIINRGETITNASRDYILYANNYSGASWRAELQNSNGSQFPTARSSIDLTIGRLTHLSGTCDTFGFGRLYQDGILVGSLQLRTDIADINRELNIGATRQSSGLLFFFSGEISDTFVYSRALSPSEIRLLASRRGIAYEMAPRSWSAQQIAAYRAKYYSQLVGGGIV